MQTTHLAAICMTVKVDGAACRSGSLLVLLIFPLAYSAVSSHPRNLWLVGAVLPGTLAYILLLLLDAQSSAERRLDEPSAGFV